MRSHEPPRYQCPFCEIASGAEAEAIVFNDGKAIGAVSLHQTERNVGAILVFPTEHFENIYSLPTQSSNHVFAAAQALAVALKKAFACEGITLLQNNEPAGDQDVWHFHVHVVPRFANDRLREYKARAMPLESRAILARRIREGMETQ